MILVFSNCKELDLSLGNKVLQKDWLGLMVPDKPKPLCTDHKTVPRNELQIG